MGVADWLRRNDSIVNIYSHDDDDDDDRLLLAFEPRVQPCV